MFIFSLFHCFDGTYIKYYFWIITFSFGNLTLARFAYLSSLDLYPTAITTVAVNHRSFNPRISLYFSGSNHSIGHVSIHTTAAVVSTTPMAIYACFWFHHFNCSGVLDFIVLIIMFLNSINFSMLFASSGSCSTFFPLISFMSWT